MINQQQRDIIYTFPIGHEFKLIALPYFIRGNRKNPVFCGV